MDAANGVLWGDDSQLTTVVLMKNYGATPGVWLSLSQHPETT
jgi:Holliday junction resolvase RusA-like endonuclease